MWFGTESSCAPYVALSESQWESSFDARSSFHHGLDLELNHQVSLQKMSCLIDFFSKIFRKLSNLLFVWLGEQTWQQVTYFVSYCYLTTNTCKEVGSIHLFYFLIALWNKYPLHRLLFIWVLALMIFTAWKVSKCRVFSGPYFPAFVLNTEKLSVLSRSDYYHHW